MAKKSFVVGMLALVLTFGFVVVGCEDDVATTYTEFTLTVSPALAAYLDATTPLGKECTWDECVKAVTTTASALGVTKVTENEPKVTFDYTLVSTTYTFTYTFK